MADEQKIQTPGGPIGQYYLLDKIAQGGMAEIYKGLAYDLHGIRRTVVIKKILPHIAAHREFIDMLVTEAKLAVQLSHGNIAQVYDLGKVGDDYFMVMEFVDGKSVSQIMRRAAQLGETIPLPIAIHIAAEAAAGLHYMHSRSDSKGEPLNIIHRDMSPQNLMITEGGTVKIIDFGIAKAASSIEITDVGVVKGKFAYMSPEQANGIPLDSRSDIFSLGVVLFEMTTGRRLFKGKDNQETLRNVRRANIPRPSLYRSEIPESLENIILRTLSKSREGRYQTGGDLRDSLLQCLYTCDAGFQSADIEKYINRIFEGDTSDTATDDVQTPLLIIDRTQSAILQPDQPIEAPPTTPVPEQAEWSPEFTSAQTSKRRQTWTILVIAAVIISLIAAGYAIWRSNSLKQADVIQGTPQIIPSMGSDDVNLPELPKQTTQTPATKPYGDIVIESDPSAAEIYIDDVPTHQKTPHTLTDLSEGRQLKVGLFLRGYKYWAAAVTVRAGGLERLHAKLEKDYASLEVHTTPSGADVLVNDELVGRTPLHLSDLDPGRVLNILIKKDGYIPWQTQEKTASGRLLQIHRELTRDPKAIVRPTIIEPNAPAPTTLPHVK